MQTENLHTNYSGTSIAKNTIFNLLGYGIPLIFALVLIPFLIKGLGEERFGILNLAWVVIGYFSFFDFGIGRVLTKIVAEKIGIQKQDEIPAIFWTSLFLIFSASIIGSIIVVLITPSLVYDFFQISENLQMETLDAFYILAVSIPIVTTTAGIRGVLEAYQKFGIINIIRVILGVSTFLGPFLCLIFTNSLFWIIAFLTLIRFVIWLLYLNQCFKLNVNLKRSLLFQHNLIKPILKLSGWMTVSNIIVPLIIYMDRFLIGALASAEAVTYYATPYEAVTKLLLIPGALIGVLFPAFSANYISNPDFTKSLSIKAVKFVFIILFPVILLVITFAREGMSFWLDEKFSESSSLILQFLALGVLFNSLAYIPFSLLQGIGKPDITAKINLVELPFYVLGIWIAIRELGINGAALVWMLRMIIDALLLFFFANKQISVHYNIKIKLNHLLLLIVIIASIFPNIVNDINLKFLLVTIVLLIFAYISWKFFLLEEERIFFISKLKIFSSQ